MCLEPVGSATNELALHLRIKDPKRVGLRPVFSGFSSLPGVWRVRIKAYHLPMAHGGRVSPHIPGRRGPRSPVPGFEGSRHPHPGTFAFWQKLETGKAFGARASQEVAQEAGGGDRLGVGSCFNSTVLLAPSCFNLSVCAFSQTSLKSETKGHMLLIPLSILVFPSEVCRLHARPSRELLSGTANEHASSLTVLATPPERV